MSTFPCLAIAIGNSNLRWRLLYPAPSREAAGPDHSGSAAIGAALPQALAALAEAHPVVAASVQPEQLALLEKKLDTREVTVIGRDLPMSIKNGTRKPEQTGHDRLLAALGAYQAGGPCVVVDIGTAITVDLVGPGPIFQGGVIFPGPDLCLRSLHQGTAALPALPQLPAPDGYYGKDTEEAIRCGVYWSINGAILFLTDKLRKNGMDKEGGKDGKALPVWITGGGAPLVMPQWEGRARWDPDLVFKGMAACLSDA